MIKKALSLALVMALVLSVGLTIPAMAEEGYSKTVAGENVSITVHNIIKETTISAPYGGQDELVTLYWVPVTGAYLSFDFDEANVEKSSILVDGEYESFYSIDYLGYVRSNESDVFESDGWGGLYFIGYMGLQGDLSHWTIDGEDFGSERFDGSWIVNFGMMGEKGDDRTRVYIAFTNGSKTIESGNVAVNITNVLYETPGIVPEPGQELGAWDTAPIYWVPDDIGTRITIWGLKEGDYVFRDGIWLEGGAIYQEGGTIQKDATEGGYIWYEFYLTDEEKAYEEFYGEDGTYLIGTKDIYFRIGFVKTSEPSTPVPVSNEPSSWALESVNAAIAAGIIPENLQAKYTQATTRAEFCALAVALYENVKGVELTERTGFNDTDDINVEKMAALDVVNGVGDGKFAPFEPLTREQAATMLARLANVLGKPMPKDASTFADNGAVALWAAEGVGQVQTTGIMTGIDGNLFDPQGAYTREQSIITMMRLFDYIGQ